jgi:hypothetical protein
MMDPAASQPPLRMRIAQSAVAFVAALIVTGAVVAVLAWSGLFRDRYGPAFLYAMPVSVMSALWGAAGYWSGRVRSRGAETTVLAVVIAFGPIVWVCGSFYTDRTEGCSLGFVERVLSEWPPWVWLAATLTTALLGWLMSVRQRKGQEA